MTSVVSTTTEKVYSLRSLSGREVRGSGLALGSGLWSTLLQHLCFRCVALLCWCSCLSFYSILSDFAVATMEILK